MVGIPMILADHLVFAIAKLKLSLILAVIITPAQFAF
jgi:hypothetical protein